MTVIVLNALLRPILGPRLPNWAEPRWYQSKEEALALAPEAEIGWFDFYSKADMAFNTSDWPGVDDAFVALRDQVREALALPAR